MFRILAHLVCRWPWAILGIWAVTAIWVGTVAPVWESAVQDEDVRFLPPDSLSVQGLQLMEQAFPREVFGSRLVLVVHRPDRPLSDDDYALVDKLAMALERLRQARPELAISACTTYRHPLVGARLTSQDRRCTIVNVPLGSPFLALRTAESVDAIEEVVGKELAGSVQPPEVYLTGHAGIGRDLTRAALRSLDHTTWATIGLVVVILLFIYRSPGLAALPLVAVSLAVWLSLNVLSLLSHCLHFQLLNVTRVFVIVVLFGAGTDYCLFLLSRYREEYERQGDHREAVRRSVRRVGAVLFASGAMIVAGLAAMGLAEFAKLRYTGPAIAVTLVVALAACLTLVPAIMCVCSPRVLFWPGRGREHRGETCAGPWSWLARAVVRHPHWMVAGCFLSLGPLAIYGAGVRYSYDFIHELPPMASSKRGLECIRRHFVPGEIGPLTVLLRSAQDWRGTSGQRHLQELSRRIRQVAAVAEVRSVIAPLGEPHAVAEGPKAWVAGLTHKLFQKAVQEYFLSQVGDRFVTRLEIVFRNDPFAEESVHALLQIRELVQRWTAQAGVDAFALFGVTPNIYDFAQVHEQDRATLWWIILTSVGLILLGLLRRPILVAFLLVSVLASYFATIGAAELLARFFLNTPAGEVNWKVPFFLFTIVLAVGEDYNVFLIARVQEETRRRPVADAVQYALARTGGTISCCGLIMAGTFATLMLCPLTTLIQLGMALACGVLLETFVVRPLLVPAFLVVCARVQALWREGSAVAPLSTEIEDTRQAA